MSRVELTGDWADAQARNLDVLVSLNMSQWACHFTTAANLTACATTASPWNAYIKDDPNSTAANATYTHKVGFLAAGGDVKPAENVTFSECEAFCTTTKKCLGFTFEGYANETTPGVKIKCYWKAQTAFTPAAKTNCIAAGGAEAPICEPLPGEMGLGGYYGHYQGHWLSATAFIYNATGNATVQRAAAANVATLGRVMDAWKGRYGTDGYLFPYDPLVFDKLLAGHGAGPYYSVPFYTLHKLMAGLLDQYDFAGNAQAYDLVRRMALWVHDRVEACIAAGGMELWQRVLLTEWGGMNDVLYNLYAHTGDPVHLSTARRFNGFVFTAPLAAGQDDLSKLPFPHANFHLPEIIGNARAYELTGNATDKMVVDTFFAALTTNHSYATGGSNSGECWQAPRDLGNFLSTQTQESCTQYNVLKIARRSFLVEGATQAGAKLADFYERAIWNGIIGNQNRGSASGDGAATSYIYMLPQGGANTKPWGKSDFGFPCCWGTLSESFAKLTDSIFFTQPGGGLFVNQFVSATAKLPGALEGVTVEQTSNFPNDPNVTTSLTVHTGSNAARSFPIMLRVPGWATDTAANVVTVNGQPVGEAATPGSYLRLDRQWADGDVVVAAFPMSLWTNPLNDYHPEHNATLAFMYGPFVLAGVHVDTDIFVPKGDAFKADPSSFIERNSTTALDFEATASDGSKMRMMALRDVMDEQYVVYFMTAGTKPPQPSVVYCPHSAGSDALYEAEPEIDEDELLVSAGPPAPTPSTARDPLLSHHLITSRGVQWHLANGLVTAH